MIDIKVERSGLRIPYALRRVPEVELASLVALPRNFRTGDIALATVEKVSKNTYVELASGRRCTLSEGDRMAVVFGDRYATLQFEGYGRADGDRCDMLSVGGMCGLVKSKHRNTPDPTKLRLLGAIGDRSGVPLRLERFTLPLMSGRKRPRIVVVCGTSMDSGKTYTAGSVIAGLRQDGHRVAGVKLTGSPAGRDTWSFLDAGAVVALDFVDGGLPSTYLCGVEDLLILFEKLIGAAVAQNADCAVVEIADGLLQRETAALLQTPRFVNAVDAWLVTAGDPLGALGAVNLLRTWGIEPRAVSGIVSMSPLQISEVEEATGIACLPAKQLRAGRLGQWLGGTEPSAVLHAVPQMRGTLVG